MKKILITGGPVHAHLDAVKVITNRFKGGLMVDLAETLAKMGADVTYLCAPQVGAQLPQKQGMLVVTHGGFEDYQQKVLELAPQMDGVILGAAVANLIPAKPWKGKFPSHDYKPGDVLDIPFMVAPRIIDMVKKAAPHTHLFGYKLLSGVPHEELIRAAYGIVLEAKATAVFANDTDDLMQKFVVTKERGVHPMHQSAQAQWIWEMLEDQYYSSEQASDPGLSMDAVHRLKALIDEHHHHFTHVEGGLIFGTVAVREGKGFLTTGRGKREIDTIAQVIGVDHAARKVFVGSHGKASLNSPLLARVFENPAVDHIVHYHEQVSGLPTHPYAPPGTVRDTTRPNHTSFNIKEHGCMLLFSKEGRRL